MNWRTKKTDDKVKSCDCRFMVHSSVELSLVAIGLTAFWRERVGVSKMIVQRRKYFGENDGDARYHPGGERKIVLNLLLSSGI